MSHKTRNPVSANFEKAHTELAFTSAFMNKILKHDKPVKNVSSKQGNSLNAFPLRRKDRSPPGMRKPSTNQVAKLKPTVVQQNDIEILKSAPAFKSRNGENGPTIEVMNIKPKKKPKPVSPSREPWDNLLKNKTKEGCCSSVFSECDPLRTLHFLADELKSKVASSMPNDSNVIQLVNNIQHTMKRVPPDVASSFRLSKSKMKLNKMSEEEKAWKILKAVTSEKHSQTTDSEPQTEVLQKVMEESTSRLEQSVRQMELLCGRLRTEKADLELQLKNEKQNVLFLKKRNDSLERKHDEETNMKVKALKEENETLRKQIGTLSEKCDKTSTEISSQLQELKVERMKAYEECMQLKHELSISKLEREKYLALLTIRDQQISEIKMEMDQLQQVINEQLKELTSNANSRIPSADSVEAKPSEEKCGPVRTLAESDGSKTPAECFSRLQPAGDSASMQQLLDFGCNKPGFEKIDPADNLHSIIREQLLEIKKQAYSVTDFRNDLLEATKN